MSALENKDVKLDNSPEENYEVQGEHDENEINSRSNRQDQELAKIDEDFMSSLNTKLSENSGMTVETSRAI